jgi:hypothetical protein
VSLLYVMANGAPAEIAITGNCGLVGISLFMGGETTPSRAVVQSAGDGYRLPAGIAKTLFRPCDRAHAIAILPSDSERSRRWRTYAASFLP